MVFSSSQPPHFQRELGRHVNLGIARALKEPNMRPEEGSQRTYWDKVGTLHLDRCWREQGHDHVRFSPSLPLLLMGKAVHSLQRTDGDGRLSNFPGD